MLVLKMYILLYLLTGISQIIFFRDFIVMYEFELLTIIFLAFT